MTDTFRRACLVLAVIIGCAFSAFQILHDVRVPVQLLPGVAARVNGHQIDLDSVNRTVAGMDARMRRSEAATRHDVLSRMIDEELLVQHALDSGAAQTNPEVRAALVRSAITRANSEEAAEPVSEGELSEYFEAHKQVYATVASYEVTPLYFAWHSAREDATSTHAGADAAPANAWTDAPTHGADAVRVGGTAAGGNANAVAAPAGVNANAVAAPVGVNAPPMRAAAARAAIDTGTPVDQVASTADELPFSAPGQHVSPRTLANYFGPALADAVDRLAIGHTTDVTQLGNGVVFIYLNRKSPGEVPSLASIHELVAADALRDRQERALDVLLASLHQAAHIEFAKSADPAPPVAASR